MIRASQLSVFYGSRPALREVEVAVEAGEWVAVIGPNGAGKSSLLRALAGLVEFTGEVILNGDALRELSRREIARRVAVVPQNPIIPEGMLVFEYVLLGRTPYIGTFGVEGSRDLRRVRAVLSDLELDSLARRPIQELSGGERQRVVLARALVQDPSVLLADEPVAALDIGHVQGVLELIDRLRRQRQLAVLSALHDLTLAGRYADRLVLLDGGRVVAAGTPSQVLTTDIITAHYHARVGVHQHDGGVVVVPLR